MARSYGPCVASLGDVIARNVRAERGRLGWTQQQLADALEWSSSSVGNLESGKRKVIADDIPLLCRVFRISFAQLVDRADPADLRTLRL